MLTLCDGRRAKALVEDYAATFTGRIPEDQACREARETLLDLERKGIIERAGGRPKRSSTTATPPLITGGLP